MTLKRSKRFPRTKKRDVSFKKRLLSKNVINNRLLNALSDRPEALNPRKKIENTSDHRAAIMNKLIIFTALHGMQTRSSDEKADCLSVCLSNT